MAGHAPFDSTLELHHHDRIEPARAALLTSMARRAIELLPELACDLDEVVRLCAILQCNCHELPDLTVVPRACGSSNTAGLGLFPGACRFNHSCRPTCTFHMRHRPEAAACGLRVSSTAPLLSKGEELTISYTALHRP